MWAVWARRYPGSMPVRVKSNGEEVEFATEEQAQAYAQHCRNTMKGVVGMPRLVVPHYYAMELS